MIDKSKPPNEVRVLTYNLQLIPAVVLATSDAYPSSSQEERLLDLVKSLKGYDVACLQETFGGLFSELREKLIAYATKAGFVYIAKDDDP